MSLPITEVGHHDISVLMSPGTEKRQSMQGFDDDYVDIVDYIVRCTHKIWEERGMGLIYTHYKHNVIVHTPYGTMYGRDAMLASSIFTLQAFPDRRAYADDVVWGGNDEEGFYSSHRITNVATNWGHSRYGPPTGRKFTAMTLADCLVAENRVCEEWLVRDEISMVRQLGLDVKAVVAKLARQKQAAAADAQEPVAAIERVKGQMTPEVMPPKPDDEFEIEDFVRRTWHEIWNWRRFDRVRQHYAPNYLCHTDGGRELYGQDQYIQWVMSLLATFPDGQMNIDHFCALGDPQQGYRAAVRWTFLGTHLMPGLFGEPTGKRVRLMGISQLHVRDGKFAAEWSLFDELGLRVDLYTPEA